MKTLLWAECRKLRRCRFLLLALLCTTGVTAIVFLGGNPARSSLSSQPLSCWYLNIAQPWATLFVLPAMIALFGSYLICREEEEGTLNALLLIPVRKIKLISAKMLLTFILSLLLYLLLFLQNLFLELFSASELSAGLAAEFLKTYLLEGIGVFLAVSPMIVLVSCCKKNYWLALALTELYSFAGLFMSISDTLRSFYPITAVLGIAGYYETTPQNRLQSWFILVLCACVTIFVLKIMDSKKRAGI